MSKKTISDEERKTLLQNYNNKIQEKAAKESTNESEDEEEKKGSTLVIAFLLMLVFQLGNRIFGRLQTYPMHNYPLFLNIVMILVYIPICFSYIFPVMWSGSTWITKEQQEIPKYKFAVMGIYDSVAGIMQTFAVNYISNASMIVLVQQSAIPISMVISRYALQATYTKAQYIGASVVLMGIVVVLIPNFFATSDSVDTSPIPSAPVPDATTQLIWLLVLIVSCVPMCMSSVYKEKALGETEIDIVYLNGWVAVFQFLIALPLCLPTAQIQNLPISEIWPNMVDGMKCWLGVNSITEDNNPHNLPLDDCSTAPLFVTIYLFFNVVFNFLVVVILKLGSANIMFMASTVIVPLSNVAFSLDFMPGHQPLRFWDIIGLLVIMFGLVVYRFSKEVLSSYERVSAGGIMGLFRSEDASVSTTTTPNITAARAMEAKRARQIAKKAQEKQLKFLGINQMEYLQTLVESRVEKEQTQLLFRSPSQIRSTFLAKIGVPPSPHVSMGPGRRLALNPDIPIPGAGGSSRNYNALGYSPMMLSQSQRKPSFRATSGYQTSNTSNLSMSIGNSYSNRELHMGAARGTISNNNFPGSNNGGLNAALLMSPLKSRSTNSTNGSNSASEKV
jgi:drug/metabolite transporter (DMT)-like permease